MLFTVTFVEQPKWERSTGAQLEHEITRIGGILLIMGVLHAANVVAHPIIGRLLSSNKRLDDNKATASGTATASGSVPLIGPGTRILRVEALPDRGAADSNT